MADQRSVSVPMRPYARLLTMLGEQLIKNDRIALLELVKNCYDADATNVEIRFEGFGPGLEVLESSRIVITDNGDGMSGDVVRNHWLNPATDIKESRKRAGKSTTAGGRVVQGEKGIGRFAMFKLGSRVELRTRGRDEASEVVTSLDISFLDEDSGDASRTEDHTEGGPARYLDQVTALVEETHPTVFVGSTWGSHGTQLTISRLRSRWSTSALKALHEDLMRLRPLRQLLTGEAGEDPLAFDISYVVNGTAPEGLDSPEALLEHVAQRAVLRVVGNYDEQASAFELVINDEPRTVELQSDEIRGLALYPKVAATDRSARQFSCGDFAFEFLIFDLRPNVEPEFSLNPAEKALVKSHRIYLYRDAIRVLPYGDADDDWLQLDTIRGTLGANRVLGNDQAIGFVYITQETNPGLRDKTNREGLIDSGPAYSDFLALLQLLINYLRAGDYGRYLQDSRRRDESDGKKRVAALDERLKEVRAVLAGERSALKSFDEFAEAYETERRFMRERVERSEDLAGVGLSVETASHDVIATANQAYRDATILVEQLGSEIGRAHEAYRRAGALAESLSFIVSRLQDVQGLFVSSRKRARNLDVVQYAKKIQAIYSRSLGEAGIAVVFDGDENFTIRSHEATLLQVFLNLMDNAIYWLRVSDTPSPTITIEVNQAARSVIFSDNGPGISPKDANYIFEPFYSAKGDEGRGLGLYIASQVAKRDGLSLSLAGEERTVDGRISARFELKVKE